MKTAHSRLDRFRPEHLLLLGSVLFGIPVVFATPPFASPDEPGHFFRAWAISEGNLVAEEGQELRGAWLPSGLAELVEKSESLRRPGSGAFSREAVAALVTEPLDPNEREFVDFRNALQIPFLMYLPQALGCAIAKVGGTSALTALYAGRLLNLVAATALLALAVRRLPEPRWWLCAFALTPMALTLRASFSADALVLAISIAFLAEVSAAAGSTLPAEESGFTGRWRDIWLLALTIALGWTKPVYLPLVLLLFLARGKRRHEGFRRLAIFGALAIAAVAGHFSTLEMVPMRFDVHVDQEAKVEVLYESPIQTGVVLVRDLVIHGPRYLAQALGHRLGWLDVALPVAGEVAVAIALALLLVVERRGPLIFTSSELWLIGVSLFASAILIELSLWLQWTPLRESGVVGVQGRYFLPLFLPAAWIVRQAGSKNPAQRFRFVRTPLLATLVVAASGISSLISLAAAFGD